MWGYGPDYGMMGGWGYGGYGGYGPVGMIIWIIILIAVIVAVVWLVRSLAGAGANHRPTEQRSSGLDVLDERYARGEINRDEYLQKKRDLG